MAGGIISLIGGNPLMKVKQVIGESLPLTKSLDGGAGLGDMIRDVVSGGGLGSIISNPMGALTGIAQGVIGNAASSLQGVAGAGALIGKLTGSGGLGEALGTLASAGDGLLSGQGILDMVGHANLVDMFGAALPAEFGLDKVVGPLASDALLTGINTAIPAMVQDVMTGTLSVSDAIAQVDAHIADLADVVGGSTNALTTVASNALDIAAVSTVAAATVAAPPEIQAVLQRAVAPEALAIMRASVASHLEEPKS